MDWRQEIKDQFKVIGGGAGQSHLLDVMQGRHSGKGSNPHTQKDRFIEVRIDSEFNVISGDVFLDQQRKEPAFSFISESICYAAKDQNAGKVVAPVDMFDHPEIGKGAVLLKHDGKKITDCHIKCFSGSSGSARSLLRADVSAQDLKHDGDELRRLKLEVFNTSGIAVPKIFKKDNPQIPRLRNVKSVEDAFLRAGVDMVVQQEPKAIDVSGALANDGKLRDDELHALLVESAPWVGERSWNGRLLFASRWAEYANRSGNKLGRMFDKKEPARQGAAIFVQAIEDSKKDEIQDLQARREEVEYLKFHTTVHEIGHMFNLLHTHQKDLHRQRARMARPGALSWMAYRHRFPFGVLANYVGREAWLGHDLFRAEFAEVENFDDEELRHIRHGSFTEVVPGGTWATAQGRQGEFANTTDLKEFDDTKEVNLSIELTHPAPGTPLEQFDLPQGKIVLRNATDRLVDAPRGCDPDGSSVTLWIKGPQHKFARRYEPLFYSCGEVSPVKLDKKGDDRDSMEARLPTLVGPDGWYVGEPGRYELQAVCVMPGGGTSVSKVVSFDVTKVDKASAIEKLIDHPEVGTFAALNGSVTGYFHDVLEIGQKLTTDHPDLRFTGQMEIYRQWASMRYMNAGDTGTVSNADRHANAANFLQLTGTKAGARWITSNLQIMDIVDIVLDSCRTISAYRDAKDVAAVKAELLEIAMGLIAEFGTEERLQLWFEEVVTKCVGEAEKKAAS